MHRAWACECIEPEMTVAAASATLVAHFGHPRCTSAAFGCIPRASTRETALEKRRRVQCPMLREDARRAREQLRKGETEKAGRKTGLGPAKKRRERRRKKCRTTRRETFADYLQGMPLDADRDSARQMGVNTSHQT